MNFIQKLRARRVPQYVSGYVIGCWGLMQFFDFLEERLLMSPHLVNLIGLALVALLPSVTILAWRHGRPGKDSWDKTDKIAIPANLAAATLVLLLVFADKDLGAVTETVRVQDEHGAVTERAVLKGEYRRRVMLFYLDSEAPPEDAWLRHGLSIMIGTDMSQDPFVDTELPIHHVDALQRSGHPDGLDLPRPLQRKLAREALLQQFVTGSYRHTDTGWSVTLDLHDTESGRVVATIAHEGADLYALVDEVSRQLRRDLGVPKGHLESQEDRPVVELLSADPEAIKSFVAGVVSAIHLNDWEAALEPLQAAVERDSNFASAQYVLYAVCQLLGHEEEKQQALTAAMENIYRLPERSQFQIKALYYRIEKQDPDKCLAVLEMWSQLYPNDVPAQQQLATFKNIQGDVPGAIAALEKILVIDPSRHQTLLQIASLYREEGDFESAERDLRRYAELYPGHVSSYESLADLYLDAGRLEEARDALERAQLIEPNSSALITQLAQIDLNLGRFEAAESALRDALAAASSPADSLDVLVELAQYHMLRGEMRRAVELMDQWRLLSVGVLDPVSQELIYAFTLSTMVDAGQAEAVLERIQTSQLRVPPPNDGLLGMSAVPALIELGRLDEAAASVQMTESIIDQFKLEQIRPRLLLMAGRLAEAQSNLAAAAAHYADALKGNPTSNTCQRYHGRGLRLLKRSDAAQTALEAALTGNPGHPRTNLEMALLLQERGRDQEGLRYAERTVAAWEVADPGHEGAEQARRLVRELAAAD